MRGVKATFVFDKELYKAFKEVCQAEGRRMTWYLSRCMRETVEMSKAQALGVPLAAAEKRSRSRQAGKKNLTSRKSER